MLWERADWVPLGVIRDAGNLAAKGRSMSRQEVAAMAMAIYRNHFADLVDEQLRGCFGEENYQDLRLHLHTSSNVLEEVVQETACAYQEPATRYLREAAGVGRAERATATGRVFELLSLEDPELLQEEAPVAGPAKPGGGPAGTPQPGATSGASSVPTGAEPAPPTPFDRWLEASDLDALWSEVQRLARFNPVVWVMPVVRATGPGTTDADGKVTPPTTELCYDVYTPFNADVELDPQDCCRAAAFYTWRDEPVGTPPAPGGRPETKRFYYRWTATEYEKFDADWKPVPGTKQPNPLGRLPVVAVRLGKPLDGYFLDGIGCDLIDATLEVCVLRTLQNRAYRDASFKQLAVSGDKESFPAGQVIGNPALPITLGEQGDSAQVLDFAPDLAALSAVVKERREEIAAKHGISPGSFTMTEKAQSGFSKKMDSVKVLRRNRQDRKWLAAGETELFELCALLLSIYGVPAIGVLPRDADFVVDFADPVFEEEPLTQARADAIRLKLGTTNILELYLRDNPDLTEEEGIRALAVNQAINRRFTPSGGDELLTLLAEGGAKAPGGGGDGGGGQGGAPAVAGGAP